MSPRDCTRHLGDDRLPVLYNHRYGEQDIVVCLVTFTLDAWTIHHEGLLHDARRARRHAADVTYGIEEFADLQCRFPTVIHRQDGSLLATHWPVENGACGSRWTKPQITW